MKEYKDNMDEIWEAIEKASDDVDIPESLLPENVVEKLKKESEKEKRNKMRGFTELAAAVAVVVAIGGVGTNYYMDHGAKFSGTAMENSADCAEESAAIDTGLNATVSEETCDVAESVEVKKPKKEKIGEVYHLAKNYDEIYDKLKEHEKQYEFGYTDDLVMEDSASMNSGAQADKEESVSDLESSPLETSKGEDSYSSTNTQEKGIDESDIVKTDGKYIYRVWNNKVYIIDIQSTKMKQVGIIELVNNAVDTVKEIYLDHNKLCVITECVDTNLDKNEKENDVIEDRSDVASYATSDLKKGFYSINTKISTKISVYNIENKKNPVLEGEMVQDGRYHTSRKVNDRMYLFTTKNFGRFYTDYEDAIPYVQGKKIEADCIYIPEKYVSNELIAASLDINQPDQVIDQLVVMSSYADIYMGQNAFYLYERDYVSNQSYMNISKFKYDKDGYMYGVNATSVKGDIEDTFAISEKEDNLRVLTTDWSQSDRVNQLYILDDELKLKGKIENIAKGESIYAARYIGDMAYFITYRNTDPLFVADLSNPAKPKLLGSVKISGFSDYLHPYGKDRILGIGYETDENSQRLGVKLCMFDVSNPKKPKVLKSFVMKEVDDTPAANEYKCVLVDVKKNLIGFLVEDYDSQQCYTYKVFSWKNGKFKQVFSKKLKNKDWIDRNEVRGLYSGNTFYLMKENTFISYNMKDKYKKIASIKLQ